MRAVQGGTFIEFYFLDFFSALLSLFYFFSVALFLSLFFFLFYFFFSWFVFYHHQIYHHHEDLTYYQKLFEQNFVAFCLLSKRPHSFSLRFQVVLQVFQVLHQVYLALLVPLIQKFHVAKKITLQKRLLK